MGNKRDEVEVRMLSLELLGVRLQAERATKAMYDFCKDYPKTDDWECSLKCYLMEMLTEVLEITSRQTNEIKKDLDRLESACQPKRLF